MTHYLYLTKYNSTNVIASTRFEIAAQNPSSYSLRRWQPHALTNTSHPPPNHVAPLTLCDENPISASFQSPQNSPDLDLLLTNLSCTFSKQNLSISNEDYCSSTHDDESFVLEDDVASVHSTDRISSSSGCSVSFDSFSSGNCSFCNPVRNFIILAIIILIGVYV